MSSYPYFYTIGYKVGEAIVKAIGRKNHIIVSYDTNNGSDTADGITEPTSNFLNALISASKYYETTLKFASLQDQAIGYATIHYIINQTEIHFDGSECNIVPKIVFMYLDDEKKVLANLIFENAYVKFSNLIFQIPDDINPPAKGYLPLIPFTFKNCIVKFENCKFIALTENSNTIFVYGENSFIQTINCEFEGGNYTFCYSPTLPSYYTDFDSEIKTGEIVLKDTSDSYWYNIVEPQQ